MLSSSPKSMSSSLVKLDVTHDRMTRTRSEFRSNVKPSRHFRLSLRLLTLWVVVFLTSHLSFTDAIMTKTPPLVVATHLDIRLVNGSMRKIGLVRNLVEGTALDINFRRNRMCWADHGAESIQCVQFNGSQVTGPIQNVSMIAGPVSAEGMAIDWYTGNFYWTDGELNTIEVANENFHYRKVLYWTDIDQPRAIALVPMKSFIFWTDWGEVPKIERASMNGILSSRRIVVSDNVYWPNGLTVDYQSEKIYWLDGKLKFIDVMSYDGTNRVTLATEKIKHPFAITFFDKRLYWTDWSTSFIYTMNVSHPSISPREVVHSEIVPMAVRVWDEGQQPFILPGNDTTPCQNCIVSPCQTNNGGCSHLCLLADSPPYYNCACPTGILLKDKFTCRDEAENILLFAQKNYNSRISLDTLDYTAFVIPLKETKITFALDFDPIDNFLYWTDDGLKAIRRAKLDGSEESDVLTTEIEHPDGIALDWIARNMYWTDSGYDRIEVARLNGSSRKVIVYEDLAEPRAIAVAPVHGYLFWTDWDEKRPKIERACLDGSERVVIVSKDLGWPNGLALDLKHSKVYWGDANKDKIEVANMDGSDRRVVINDNLPHMFGLSLLGEYLYWTDWQRRSIDRVKVTGKGRQVISESLPSVMGIKAVHLGKPDGTNPCAINNGGCSHLCLNRPHDYVCGCQIDQELAVDNRTCVVPEVFLLYAKPSRIGRISIENGNAADIPVTGVKMPRHVDFDIANNRIYWSDGKSHSIFRAYFNGSDVQRVVESGIGSPEGMAVDWVALNIYWTNAEARRIEVARINGLNRRTIVWKDIEHPSAIVVDPSLGLIIWTELSNTYRIARAAMDGSQRKTIVHDAGDAQCLAFDYETKNIFWCDGRANAIKSATISGTNVMTLVMSNDNVIEPFSLTLWNDAIYWYDRNMRTIEHANKLTGLNRSHVSTNVDRMDDLTAYHASKQSGWNTCAVDNGGCRSLCFATPVFSGNVPKQSISHVCGCPTHFKYDVANNICVAPETYLLFSQKNTLNRVLTDANDCPDTVLPFQTKMATAIEYDPMTQYFYWIENKQKTIRRALDDGTHASVVVRDGAQPFDLALDPLGRLLFWSDEKENVINVTRLNNGSSVGVIVSSANGHKPRHLALHVIKRLLYWSDVGDNEGRIYRAKLDGSQKQVLVSMLPISSPIALAIDMDMNLLFWTNERTIYVSDLLADKAKKLYASPKMLHFHNVAVLGHYLYFVDADRNQIERIDKILGTKASGEGVLSHKTTMHITDLIAVKPLSKDVYNNHTCSTKNQNGHCSHLCVWSPDDNRADSVCACPPPLLLHTANKQTCIAELNCGHNSFACVNTLDPSGKECIPAAWRCDGQKDCPDESDEQHCPDCAENEFKCQNGQCIIRAWVCDGSTHCPDGSDEARCCDKLTDFQCPSSGVCVSVYKLCDGWEHCADGADEAPELCSNPDFRKTETFTPNTSNKGAYVVALVVLTSLLVVIVFAVYHCRIKTLSKPNQVPYDQAIDPLNPPKDFIALQQTAAVKSRQTPSGVRMSSLSATSPYDRGHITGASSSTNGGSTLYQMPLNPPPSPATTAESTRTSSMSRYRPYRYYRSVNQPPPPTPCSTDIYDESDSNCAMNITRREPFPPPPTPRSHCHWGSCPPSPSSRSSTAGHFSPLPPPPSPVPSSSRRFDC